MSVCRSSPLPCTWSSRPGWSFNRPTSSTTSPVSSVVPAHVASLSVRVATYLGRWLSGEATGSSASVTRGQKAAKIS